MRAEAVVRDVLNQQPFVVKLQIRIVPEALRDERPELLDDELTEAAAQQPFVHAAPERLLLTRQRIELRSREIENEAPCSPSPGARPRSGAALPDRAGSPESR